MKTIIRLEHISIHRIVENVQLKNKPERDYSREEIVSAYCYASARGVKFNTKTGELSDIEGSLSRYTRAADYDPVQNIEDIIEWYFSWHLRGEIARNRNLILWGNKSLW